MFIYFLMFVLVAAVIVLFVGMIILYGKVKNLQRQITLLSQKGYNMSAAPSEHVKSAAVENRPAEVITPDVTEPPPLTIPQPPAFPRPGSPSREEWESIVGGKILNRIGAFALIIGIGFFLKYAFENNWISEVIRVLIGTAAGALLLAGGIYSHKKNYQIFGQGLTGAGSAALYLSIYAAFNLYSLLPQWLAFILMSAVTALTFLMAVKYDSIAVSLIGWAGGFTTPFLLGTGQTNAAALFTYILLLDIGLLAVLYKKYSWSILEPLTLGATYLLYFFWFFSSYSPGFETLSRLFIYSFWLLFFVSHILYMLRSTSSSSPLSERISVRSVIPWINAALLFLGIFLLFEDSNYFALAVFIPACIYMLTALLLSRGEFITQYLIIGGIFIFASAEIQFNSYITVISCSALALFFIYLTVRRQSRGMEIFSYILFITAAVRLITADNYPLVYLPLLNQRAASYFALAAALFISTGIMERFSLPSSAGSAASSNSGRLKASTLYSLAPFKVFGYAWTAVLFIFILIEVNGYFTALIKSSPPGNARLYQFIIVPLAAALWSVYALLLSFIGTKNPVLRHNGLIYAGISAAAVILYGFQYRPLEAFTAAINIRVVLMLIVIVSLFLIERKYSSFRDAGYNPSVIKLLQIAVSLTILALLTSEVIDYYRLKMLRNITGNFPITELQNLQQLVLSGVWLLYSIILMSFGIWRRLRNLRLIAIALFGLTILKIFIYDLSFLQTLYRIFSFIGLGLILLLVSWLYQRYKELILEKSDS